MKTPRIYLCIFLFKLMHILNTIIIFTSIVVYFGHYMSHWYPEISLQLQALERIFPEALSEEVLRFVTSSMASKASNRNNHFNIWFILSKNLLETITQCGKVRASSQFAFQKLWLNVKVHHRSTQFWLKIIQCTIIRCSQSCLQIHRILCRCWGSLTKLSWSIYSQLRMGSEGQKLSA